MSKPPECGSETCPSLADHVFYPNARRVEELALYLCLYCRDKVLETKGPKQNMYNAVNAFIRKSIEQSTGAS